MRRLIVNADDFGQTSGINRAVLELHQAGVLTSASMMVNAGATDEAIKIARAVPTLGIGCHIVLTDGTPILHPKQVPSLVYGPLDHLVPSLTTFLGRLFMGKICTAEIEAETTAQIRHLQARNICVDHIDTHKHVHMFQGVLRPVLRAARACGVRSIRKPFEPRWAVKATTSASVTRSAQVSLLRRLERAWQVVLDEEGFDTTDGTIGIAATGVLDAENLQSILQKAPEGTWELVTHPGHNDPDLAKIPTKLRASREIERQALNVPNIFSQTDLVSFAALAPNRPR